MNEIMKTYGVVINMDYAHQPVTTCKAIWHKISEKMLIDDFQIEKRMFMITSPHAKENIYNKAKSVLDSVNSEMSVDENSVYNYLQDFFTVDMTDYVDLRFPDPKHGIELQEEVVENIILN